MSKWRKDTEWADREKKFYTGAEQDDQVETRIDEIPWAIVLFPFARGIIWYGAWVVPEGTDDGERSRGLHRLHL